MTFPLATLASAPPVGSRRARINAVAFDLACIAGSAVLGGLLASTWLFLRTSAGAVDAGRGDSALALAIAMAGVPAWYGLAALDVATAGATPGQRRAGLRVEGGPVARLARFAMSPAALPAWLWLSVMAMLTSLYPIQLLFASLAAAAVGLALTSTVLVATGHRGLHERITATRLVRA